MFGVAEERRRRGRGGGLAHWHVAARERAVPNELGAARYRSAYSEYDGLEAIVWSRKRVEFTTYRAIAGGACLEYFFASLFRRTTLRGLCQSMSPGYL